MVLSRAFLLLPSFCMFDFKATEKEQGKPNENAPVFVSLLRALLLSDSKVHDTACLAVSASNLPMHTQQHTQKQQTHDKVSYDGAV